MFQKSQQIVQIELQPAKKLAGILNRLQEYEEAWDSRKDMQTTGFIKPKSPASIKFVKNAKLIIHHLLVKNESLVDVSSAFKISPKKLQECIRYYLTRCEHRLPKHRQKVQLKKIKEDFISFNLKFLLKKTRGQYLTVKTMTFRLKEEFEKQRENFDGLVQNDSFINPKSVTKVLKTVLRFSWRANAIRAPKALSEANVELRNDFPRLIHVLEKLKILIVYVDE